MLIGNCDRPNCGKMINRENSMSIPVVENGQRILKEICMECINLYNEHILKFFEQPIEEEKELEKIAEENINKI